MGRVVIYIRKSLTKNLVLGRKISKNQFTRARSEYRGGRGRRRPKAQDGVNGVGLEGRRGGHGFRGRRPNVLGHVTFRAREVHDGVLAHGGGSGRRHLVRFASRETGDFTAPLTSEPICRELLGD